MTYIPPKPCRICGEIFTPIPRGSKPLAETCGSRRCRGKLMIARTPYGKASARAIEVRTAKRQARVAALLAETFGALTEREQAIFAAGHRHGYQAGFNRAYATKNATVAA